MKSEKELNELKEEVKALNEKLSTLSKEELDQVTGGGEIPADWRPGCFYTSDPCHSSGCPYHAQCKSYSKY